MQPLFAEGVMRGFGQDFLLDSYLSNHGRVSISLLFRETRYGIETEFLATGFADAPRVVTSHDFHGYLLPLAHGHLGAGSWWRSKTRSEGSLCRESLRVSYRDGRDIKGTWRTKVG